MTNGVSHEAGREPHYICKTINYIIEPIEHFEHFELFQQRVGVQTLPMHWRLRIFSGCLLSIVAQTEAMLVAMRAKIFFAVVSFLLFTGNVTAEEGEEERYPTHTNEVMVLEFPYDRSDTNTFASTTFIAKEDMDDLTVCFAFMVNTLKSAEFDLMKLLQLQNSDGETLVEIKFTVYYDQSTYFEFSSSRSGYSYSQGPPFALMTRVVSLALRSMVAMGTMRVSLRL